MSIIESFFMLVKLDASGARKGAEDIKRASTDITKNLNSVENASKKLGESFTNSIRSMGTALVALVSVGALVAGVKSAAHLANAIQQVSEATGISAEKLSVWGDAVSKTGGTIEGFHGTVSRVTTQLTSFATKGKSLLTPFFKELGITMVDSKGKAREFFDILPELADSFQKMSKAESFGIGQKIGLDEGTIRLLQKGRSEIQSLIIKQKELGIITAKDAEIAAKFKNQWADMSHALRTVFVQVNSYLLPVLTKLFNGIEKVFVFVNRNKASVTYAVSAIAIALTALLLPAIVSVVTAFGPFLLIGAAIAGIGYAIGLIVNDIEHFLAGNKSIIGEIIGKYPVVGEIINGIGASFKALFEIAKGLWGFLNQLFVNPVEAWNYFKQQLLSGMEILFTEFPKLKSAVDAIGNAFQIAGDIAFKIWDNIASVIKSAIGVLVGGIEKISEAYQKVKSFFSGDNEVNVRQQMYDGASQLAVASNTPFNSFNMRNILTPSKQMGNRSTAVTMGDVNIQTQATDAEGISNNIRESLETQLKQAINNYDDGVAA